MEYARFGGMGRASHAPYPQIWSSPREFQETQLFLYNYLPFIRDTE